MDKRLLFPALAMTAVAQTTSPANAKAEKALRARAEEFYKLELNKQFRQAEALVAEESKDYFYNSGKPNFRDVKVGNIEFTEKGREAIVHIVATVELMAPGVGAQVFTAPATSNWRLDKGQWFWYFDKNGSTTTPFGRMKFADRKPGTGMTEIMNKGSRSIESLVTVDRTSVTLTADHPIDKVDLTNNLPGSISISLEQNALQGIHAEVERTSVGSGETAVVRIQRVGAAKPGKLIVNVQPLNLRFDIQVDAQ